MLKFETKDKSYTDETISTVTVELAHKPTKADVKEIFAELLATFPTWDKYQNFKPTFVSCYPFVFGWSTGWNVVFQLETPETLTPFFDEPIGKYANGKRWDAPVTFTAQNKLKF